MTYRIVTSIVALFIGTFGIGCNNSNNNGASVSDTETTTDTSPDGSDNDTNKVTDGSDNDTNKVTDGSDDDTANVVPDGSDDDTANEVPNGSDDDTANEQVDVTDNINGELSGRIFIGGVGDGWMLDLRTGRYTRIPGIDWENQSEEYHPMADFMASPMAFSDELILAHVGHCQKTTDPNYTLSFDECMMVLKKDGTWTGNGTILLEDVSGVPKINRSSDAIAFFYEDCCYGLGLSLVVTDIAFNIIQATPLFDTNFPVSLDWLPDGRIAYINERTIYISDPTGADSTVIHTFDESQGIPEMLRVSPDGRQLLFILRTHATVVSKTATPWLINVDGTNLRQLAHTPDGVKPSFNLPAWSPDGKYILFTHGRVASDDITVVGVPGGLFAIPSESDNIVFDAENADVIQIRSYLHMIYDHSDPDLTTNFGFNEDGLYWLPE